MENPLDEDSFLVQSWADLYVWAIRNGKKEEFLKKMGVFLHVTHMPIRKELRDNALAAEGQLIHESMLPALERSKKRREGKRPYFMRRYG